MKTTMKVLIGTMTIYLAILSLNTAQADDNKSYHRGSKNIKFDVAENGARFVFDDAPVHEDTTPPLPAYGNPFITEGYIYPHGTIQCDDEGGCTGTNSDGSAQFPDKVIGRWTCRGWFVGNGMLTETGPIVITTQLYDFGEMPGDKTIISEGYELVDFNVAVKRAITGGTGKYLFARGEAKQALLGFNESMGVSLRFKLKVKNF
jgi:hypothetical protein